MNQTGKLIVFAFLLTCLFIYPASAATSIPFTVNLSKVVNVTGTPRIAVDVGGVTRYATYTSGTGTSALIFTYAMVAGDVDLDGVTVSSPIDLNGGTIKDLSGNDLSPLTFTVPNTSNVKINYPSLGMDFVYDADGRYTLNDTVYNDPTSFLSAVGGSFTRSSVATYFDSAGVLQTAASGVPRFDYDPIILQPKGLLIEESRTNLFINSAAFNLWNQTNTTVTANTTTAPDGTTSADTWTRNSTSSSYIGQSISKSASALTYTQSVYAKKNVGNYIAIRMQGAYPARADLVANLNTGTISTTASGVSGFTSASGGIQNVGNGWYRITLSATTDTATVVAMYISFNSGGGVLDATDTVSNSSGYLWGAQFEQASTASSYIPTTTIAVTRAADTFTVPTGSWFNSSEGALSINALNGVKSNTVGIVSIDQSAFGGENRISLIRTSATNIEASVRASNITQFVTTMSGNGNNALNKIGLGYKLNNFRLALNNTLGGLDTAGTIPTVDTLRLGAWGTPGGNIYNGWIQKMKYYPTRVSDTQLQLTTQ